MKNGSIYCCESDWWPNNQNYMVIFLIVSEYLILPLPQWARCIIKINNSMNNSNKWIKKMKKQKNRESNEESHVTNQFILIRAFFFGFCSRDAEISNECVFELKIYQWNWKRHSGQGTSLRIYRDLEPFHLFSDRIWTEQDTYHHKHFHEKKNKN